MGLMTALQRSGLSVVLFHPDYTVGFGIAPKSADLSSGLESARRLAPVSSDMQ